MGTLIVLPLTTWYSKSHATPACFYLMLAATIVYISGVMGVTAFGNIPLNNALEKLDIATTSPQQLSAKKILFQSLWNKYHLIRTIASILTTSLATAAIIKE